LTAIASFLHAKGLAWVIKNPDGTRDGFASLMYPMADMVLTEQCNEFGSCAALAAYEGHKLILNAEYNLAGSAFCASDAAAGISGVRFSTALDGTRSPC
jgi:hypothetical protein